MPFCNTLTKTTAMLHFRLLSAPLLVGRSRREQFIVLAAGGHHIFYPQKISDHLIAYALPEK